MKSRRNIWSIFELQRKKIIWKEWRKRIFHYQIYNQSRFVGISRVGRRYGQKQRIDWFSSNLSFSNSPFELKFVLKKQERLNAAGAFIISSCWETCDDAASEGLLASCMYFASWMRLWTTSDAPPQHLILKMLPPRVCMRGREVELVGVCPNPSLLMGFNVPVTSLPSLQPMLLLLKQTLSIGRTSSESLFFSWEKEKDVWEINFWSLFYLCSMSHFCFNEEIKN